MSQDLPSFPEIIRTVREFIEEITDELQDQDRYHALCAVHLLNIADRELGLGATLDAQEHRRLESFLERSGTLTELYATLGAEIRAGHCDQRWDEAFDLVLAHVIGKVRVTKPEHLDTMHR